MDEFPKFESGGVLTAEQLVLLRDFPREMEAARYAGYGNGVLFGCHVTAADNAINAAPGVILSDGCFYRLNEPFSLAYKSGDAMQYINAVFTDESPKAGIHARRAEIVLSEKPASDRQLELARFKLKSGARLRSDYTGFDDLITEFDTLNPVFCPQACEGGRTLRPYITKMFGKEALDCEPENPADMIFGMMCLQEDHINLSVLQAYLGRKNTDLRELYLALAERLAVIRSSRSTAGRMRKAPPKIMVD
jgi:hypothetical protein